MGSNLELQEELRALEFGEQRGRVGLRPCTGFQCEIVIQLILQGGEIGRGRVRGGLEGGKSKSKRRRRRLLEVDGAVGNPPRDEVRNTRSDLDLTENLGHVADKDWPRVIPWGCR
jgi:hypothetical protein